MLTENYEFLLTFYKNKINIYIWQESNGIDFLFLNYFVIINYKNLQRIFLGKIVIPYQKSLRSLECVERAKVSNSQVFYIFRLSSAQKQMDVFDLLVNSFTSWAGFAQALVTSHFKLVNNSISVLYVY